MGNLPVFRGVIDQFLEGDLTGFKGFDRFPEEWESREGIIAIAQPYNFIDR